jgi:hypothetical protein
MFSAGMKIAVDKNLENTVWQGFWRLFNKVLWTIYAYLKHLESYHCILRWLNASGVILKNIFFVSAGRPAWAEPCIRKCSLRAFCLPLQHNWVPIMALWSRLQTQFWECFADANFATKENHIIIKGQLKSVNTENERFYFDMSKVCWKGAWN